MEETQRPRRGLAAVCCLFFAGALLPVPGTQGGGGEALSPRPSAGRRDGARPSAGGGLRPRCARLPTAVGLKAAALGARSRLGSPTFWLGIQFLGASAVLEAPK